MDNPEIAVLLQNIAADVRAILDILREQAEAWAAQWATEAQEKAEAMRKEWESREQRKPPSADV